WARTSARAKEIGNKGIEGDGGELPFISSNPLISEPYRAARPHRLHPRPRQSNLWPRTNKAVADPMALDPNQVNLHPQAKALLDFLAQAGRIPYSEITPPLARAQMAELIRRTKKTVEWPVTARDLEIAGPAGRLRARLVTPREASAAALPVLAYVHGGGWCIGDLETHDPVCRQIAAEAKCAVFSLDYRLAPEHRFPAAVEDC